MKITTTPTGFLPAIGLALPVLLVHSAIILKAPADILASLTMSSSPSDPSLSLSSSLPTQTVLGGVVLNPPLNTGPGLGLPLSTSTSVSPSLPSAAPLPATSQILGNFLFLSLCLPIHLPLSFLFCSIFYSALYTIHYTLYTINYTLCTCPSFNTVEP
jgi:hypothetical protein